MQGIRAERFHFERTVQICMGTGCRKNRFSAHSLQVNVPATLAPEANLADATSPARIAFGQGWPKRMGHTKLLKVTSQWLKLAAMLVLTVSFSASILGSQAGKLGIHPQPSLPLPKR